MVHSRYSLLSALVVTTVVVTVALSWAGWQLLKQQRDIDEQQTQRQLEAAAESVAAVIRGKLAETGDKLSAALANPQRPAAIADAVVLTVRPDGSAIAAAGALPFVPKVPDSSADDGVFSDAQRLEFVGDDLAGAGSRYQHLTEHANPAIRAGAWLRLGRVARKRGDAPAALRAYQQLADFGDARVEQLPAGFIGLYQQRAIGVASGDSERQRRLTSALVDGLNAGRWLLTRGQAEFYRDELGSAAPDTWPLATAIERLWSNSAGTFTPRGQRVFNEGDRSVLVMWRGGGSGTAFMASFLDQFLPSGPRETSWQLADSENQWIAGVRAVPSGLAPARVVGDAEYPWMLRVVSTAPARGAGNETTLVAMMVAMLVFLWGATYFMARAIRREAAVARLQSDFVAAVSHEFRSPLTTIRQMTEMLEIGRVPSEERRQTYYSVLTSEAARLQRLVETVLNFGRMEAGAARYRLEDIDLAALVRRVVAEIEPSARDAGKRIETSGPESDVWIRADGNALGLAVRNLIENAIKYSPGQPIVRIELGLSEGHASVHVIDQGIGIPGAEQQQIFDKFVRGRAAIEGNVAGTGVGLAMVRHIATAHSGHVTVESEVGKGSTFTLVLPLVNSQLPTPNAQNAVTAEPLDGRGRPLGRPNSRDAVVRS